MLLVLTYELQVVLRASPLLTGAALVPWAIASSLGAAVIGPRLMHRLTRSAAADRFRSAAISARMPSAMSAGSCPPRSSPTGA